MTEVLYTMRNGKIVDPNIPMDGLVCYLDTRGKNNTDIYRNTLLDLSGNRNNGALQNFSFTEESGYIKDLSGTSGLQFDGVDDFMNLNALTGLSEYTFYAEMNVGDWNPNTPTYINSSDFIIYKNSEDNKIMIQLGYSGNNTSSWTKHDRTNVDRVLITRKGSHLRIQLDDKYYSSEKLTDPLNSMNIDFGRLGKSLGRNGELLLKKALFWNRALTDEETQQLMEV